MLLWSTLQKKFILFDKHCSYRWPINCNIVFHGKFYVLWGRRLLLNPPLQPVPIFTDIAFKGHNLICSLSSTFLLGRKESSSRVPHVKINDLSDLPLLKRVFPVKGVNDRRITCLEILGSEVLAQTGITELYYQTYRYFFTGSKASAYWFSLGLIFSRDVGEGCENYGS